MYKLIFDAKIIGGNYFTYILQSTELAFDYSLLDILVNPSESIY